MDFSGKRNSDFWEAVVEHTLDRAARSKGDG